MDQPLVSVVLPTYNGSRWLAESIESCLNQSFTDWELIIVDDASSDSTPDIIRRYAAMDSRIRSIRNPQNRRLPGSLNVGFAQARGEYLTWTSDDNAYRPEALEVMTAYLAAHPEADLVYTDFSLVDADKRFVELYKVPSRDEFCDFGGCGACFLYRRSLSEKVGNYAEDLFLAEDYDYWLRASMVGELHVHHRDLYLYRQHDASLTQTRNNQVRQAADQALERNLPQLSWMTSSQRAKAHVNLANGALSRSDAQKVRQHIFSALRLSPGQVARHGKQALCAAVFGCGLAHYINQYKLSHQAR